MFYSCCNLIKLRLEAPCFCCIIAPGSSAANTRGCLFDARKCFLDTHLSFFIPTLCFFPIPTPPLSFSPGGHRVREAGAGGDGGGWVGGGQFAPLLWTGWARSPDFLYVGARYIGDDLPYKVLHNDFYQVNRYHAVKSRCI